MKILKVILLLSVLFLQLSSCKNNPLEISEPSSPGRRDYIWKVDTIKLFNPISRLWGSSPSDVWGIAELNGYEDFYHFDGNKWTTGKYIITYNPYSIFGFSNNNVFIGGNSGKIYHFNGSDWELTASLTKDGINNIVFDNIWGESSEDLFATGAYPDKQLLANNSVIAHFSNKQWEMINTDGLIGNVEKLYKNISDQSIYLQVIKISNTYDSTSIYKYNKGKYSKLYSTEWGKYWANISLINKEVYFILNSEIAKRVNNKFQTILKLDNTNFFENIWGRNAEDIFLEMTDGLAHYNGTDIQYLFYFNKQPRTQIWGAALFNQEIFFLVYEGTTGLNLIYHGILK